jgi:hypothetical protein
MIDSRAPCGRVNRNKYLTLRQLRFLRWVVGLMTTRRQLEAILNAPAGDVYGVAIRAKQGPWLIRPGPAPRSKKGWPAGVRRTVVDRLSPRTGRPRQPSRAPRGRVD